MFASPEPMCPQIQSPPFIYLLCISEDIPCRLHFQVHLSAGLGLVSATMRNVPLGDGGVRRSQAISSHCSFRSSYISCVCDPSSPWIGHHYLSLGSSKKPPLCSRVESGSRQLQIISLVSPLIKCPLVWHLLRPLTLDQISIQS